MTDRDDARANAGMSVVRRRFMSFADAEAFLANHFDPVAIRPVGPEFRISSTLAAFGDLRVWSVRTSTGFESLPGERPSRYWMCFPLSGAQDVRSGAATQSIRGGEGWIASTDGVDGLRKHPGLVEVSFDIPCAVVDDYLARSLDREPVSRRAVHGGVDMTHGPARLIARLMAGMLDSLDGGLSLHFSPVAARNFSNFVLDLMVHGVLLGDGAMTRTRAIGDRSALQRAIDFIETNLLKPMTILDIAEAAGVGPRALQVTFLRHFDCSPLQYVRRLRLGRVRVELLDEARRDSIAVIAARWGFFHLGLFARQYREAFGELPSQTRRN
jgi:AraC-like DNA-binding protein